MDDVKVTIIGVPRELRQELKVACMYSDTSISAELRRRLPRIAREIQGEILAYDEVTDLLLAMMGIVNLCLQGREHEARTARQELTPDLNRFRQQILEERRN